MGSQYLDPALLAFIRFGTASLVLAPWWWRRRRIPREVSPWVLLGLLCAGLPMGRQASRHTASTDRTKRRAATDRGRESTNTF
ncbi:hypothetical protein [Pseudomonas lopnurensis]|uniref:hypothetical protein n=1 Tax=Pseudomonas lopnurensis TaxID=1477517 RepID=UPI0018793469|nr:hypothetical protein [Pseudomonas lopnurensis]MBE7375695.1 hypothetical protein [Pseudomonas lopnurensis]